MFVLFIWNFSQKEGERGISEAAVVHSIYALHVYGMSSECNTLDNFIATYVGYHTSSDSFVYGCMVFKIVHNNK